MAPVCAEIYVEKYRPYKNKKGEMQQLTLECPKLAPGAVPQLFPKEAIMKAKECSVL